MTLPDDLPVAPFGDAADADLVLRTRSGDSAAFGELWRRHYRSGVTVARSITSSLDPDDLVQESFASIYHAILKGGGPTDSFRSYLFTSIRNTAAGWGRARRETAIDELDAFEDPATSDQETMDALDRGLTHAAFRSLPTRWQEVLWYSEIEQMKPAQIAPLLGMKATAVAQLTFRAREGLREAWIQAHLRTVEDGSDCQWAIERLGAYARKNLGRRDLVKIESHLADCARCTIVASEAHEASSRLALVLLPLTLGIAGTAAYLASLQGSGAPAALAAMPSAVTQGGLMVTPAVGGAGVAAHPAMFAGSGAGSAAVTASSGGALTGMGAMAGLVAAGIVLVGGAMAGAVALPTLLAATPVSENAAIARTTPEQTLADTIPALATPVAPTPSDIPVIPISAPLAPVAAEPDVTPATSSEPVAAVTPVAAVSAVTAPVVAVPAPVTDPPAPVVPAAPAPVESTPTPTSPSPDPTPGPTDPAPGPTDPAPGPTDPTPGPTDPAPVVPAGAPDVVGSTWSLTAGTYQLTIAVVLHAAPGAKVQASVDRTVVASDVTDASGTVTLLLHPTPMQALTRTVDFAYVAGDLIGVATSVQLLDLLPHHAF